MNILSNFRKTSQTEFDKYSKITLGFYIQNLVRRRKMMKKGKEKNYYLKDENIFAILN